MARPPSPPYELGKITITQHPTNAAMQRARGYYRDRKNVRCEVTAQGKTAASARAALRKRVSDALTEHRGGSNILNQNTSLEAAAAIWLESASRATLASSTLKAYGDYVRLCINGSNLANLPLTRANDVALIEPWLEEIADNRGATAAKQARKVLGLVLKLAERREAIAVSVVPRVKTPKPKPLSIGAERKCRAQDCDYECGKRHLDTGRAFTRDEVVAIQDLADASASDVGDLVAFLFCTGVRISEALRCTSWDDLQLDDRTVRVRGTKSVRADRTLVMSEELTTRLSRRAEVHGTAGAVFGVTRYEDSLGKPRDVQNVSKSLRKVFREAGSPWAGTHTFRRTVASWMDADGHSLAEIANQLGHGDVTVTAQYLGRTTPPTHAAAVMVLHPTRPVLPL